MRAVVVTSFRASFLFEFRVLGVEPLTRICDKSQIVCVATQTLLAVNEMPYQAFILRRNQLIRVFSYKLQFYRKIAVKLNFTL